MLRVCHLKYIGLFVFLLLNLRTCAETYVVTNTNDTTEITSLRGAIIAANHSHGNNLIILGEGSTARHHLGPSVYYLTIPGADETAGRTGDLNINSGDFTIMGATSNVTIDATGLGDRVFNVSKSARLTLENLTITGGTAPQAELGSAYMPTLGAESGGAIYNAGEVILGNCIFINNSSGAGNFDPGNAGGIGGADGGAIYNLGTLSASDCLITGNFSGAGFDGAFGGNGGGIRNNGDCSLTKCIILGNEAGSGGSPEGNSEGRGGYGGNGGGIFNSGKMILEQCIIGANTAGQGVDGGDPSITVSLSTPGGPGGNGGNGGGIYNVGQLEINFSTIDGNNSGNGGNGQSFDAGGNAGSGGSGGGIFNAGELDLNTSTISSNSCGNGGNGGTGLSDVGASGGAGGGGGGIFNSGTNELLGLQAGTSELTSSTITLNVCGAGGNGSNGETIFFGGIPPNTSSGGNGGDGGGILNNGNTNAVVIRNTLIAQNLANSGGAPGTNVDTAIIPGEPPPPSPVIGNPGADGIGFDVAGGFTSGGFNLISTGDGSTGFANGVMADQVGTDASPIDPQLGPLQMNGGFTPTHALLWGSPAIDQGNCFGVHTDQRGKHRPYIYSSIPRPPGGDGSDIGAFELDVRMN